MTGSTCRNKEEAPKKRKSYCAAWTQIWIPVLREIDLEPSAKRGSNKTRALLSLYWSSQSLHLKQSSNQIPCKSTKTDPGRSSQTWTKLDQIPKSYALQHTKTMFPRTIRATNAHDWGYIFGVVTPKVRQSQTPLLEKK